MAISLEPRIYLRPPPEPQFTPQEKIWRQWVREGALLLDKEKKGWAKCINVEIFDIEHHQLCILGQLYGNYSSGLYALQFMSRYVLEGDDPPAAWSFSSRGGDYCNRFLESAWREEIETRLVA